jgi:hypothetical protein
MSCLTLILLFTVYCGLILHPSTPATLHPARSHSEKISGLRLIATGAENAFKIYFEACCSLFDTYNDPFLE